MAETGETSSRQESAAQRFIVAIEHREPGDPHKADDPQAALLEHAYDLHSAQLAGHHSAAPRTVFPPHVRGWGTPAQAPRCPHCTAAIDALVADLIRNHLDHGAGLTEPVSTPESSRHTPSGRRSITDSTEEP